MPDLILISGSINSGKTTTSAELAKRLPNTAHVKGDELRHFLPDLPLEEAISITHRVIVAVVKTYLSAGFNVVLDYPLYQPDFEKLCEAVAEDKTRVPRLHPGPTPRRCPDRQGRARPFSLGGAYCPSLCDKFA